MNYDALEVKEAIAHSIDKIVKDLFPAAKKEGREMRVGSLSGEKGRSLSISLIPSKNGQWLDRSSDEKGDIFDLVEKVEGLDYKAALEYLGDKYTKLTKKDFDIKSYKKENQRTYNLDEYTQPITDWVAGYAQAERKVSKATLEKYHVYTMAPVAEMGEQARNEVYKYICFPCFLNDKCTRISYVDVNDKSTFRCIEGAGNNLFGTKAFTISEARGQVVICEGQWDALSWAEVGINAVSVPGGAKNHKWIDEDWEWLKNFHTVVLSMDMDDAGQDEIQKIAKRLGVNRCKVVSLPLKDASDMLQAGRAEELVQAFENAKNIEPEEIRESSVLKEDVFNVLTTDQSAIGDPCFMPGLPWRVREHEYTLVYGKCGHAKSTWVGNQVAFEVSNSCPVMIASFEMPAERVIAQVMLSMAGDKAEKIKEMDHYNLLYDHFIAPNLYTYQGVTATPKHIIEVFTYAYKRLGIKKFVIDNIMTMDIDVESNKEQAEAAQMFKNFKNEYPISLIVLAHPRKPSGNQSNQPPDIHDVRGASEWGDTADNIICIWRNTDKEKIIADMIHEGASKEDIEQYKKNTESGKVLLNKHRLTGELASVRTWFDTTSRQFLERNQIPTSMITKEKASKAYKGG